MYWKWISFKYCLLDPNKKKSLRRKLYQRQQAPVLVMRQCQMVCCFQEHFYCYVHFCYWQICCLLYLLREYWCNCTSSPYGDWWIWSCRPCGYFDTTWEIWILGWRGMWSVLNTHTVTVIVNAGYCYIRFWCHCVLCHTRKQLSGRKEGMLWQSWLSLLQQKKLLLVTFMKFPEHLKRLILAWSLCY